MKSERSKKESQQQLSLILMLLTRAVSEPAGLEVPLGSTRSKLEHGTVETRSIS
jgi:hypothetical protein